MQISTIVGECTTETAILLTFYDAEELQQLQLLDLLKRREKAAKAALNARRGYEKAARELQNTCKLKLRGAALAI